MRIASLLPAATELACALGLDEHIVAISFECDHPPHITRHPRMVQSSLKLHGATPAQIDAAVSARLQSGHSLYWIDETLLRQLRPDIILTQNLCQVCAPSGNELSQALHALDYTPQVLFMSPQSLADIEANLRQLAALTQREAAAQRLLADWRQRRQAVQARAAARPHPRVIVLEWLDPLFSAGHWLAEMVELAGGHDPFARKGQDSVRIHWDDVRAFAPEIIIAAPCGYNEAQAMAQLPLLERLPGWRELPAVKNGRVHAVDANAYLVRPGPRLIDGLEMLERFFA